jgi:hypothetical protein
MPSYLSDGTGNPWGPFETEEEREQMAEMLREVSDWNRKVWQEWCEEQEIRLAAARTALFEGHLTVGQIRRRYGAVRCQHCGRSHV